VLLREEPGVLAPKIQPATVSVTWGHN
jgi:hypothetical protein